MRTAIVVCLLTYAMPPGRVPQAPNDPGLQDSIIVSSARLETVSDSIVFDVFAFTDDSVVLVDIPMEWHARLKGFRLRDIVYADAISRWRITETVDTLAARIRVQAAGIEAPFHSDCDQLQLFSLIFDIGAVVPGYCITAGRIFKDNEIQPHFGLPDGSVFMPATIGGNVQLPMKGYIYEQNWPNPFGGPGDNFISFNIPNDRLVKHEIFNIAGELKFDLDTDLLAGHHFFVFTQRDEKKERLPKGNYLYRITAGDSTWAKKMVVW